MNRNGMKAMAGMKLWKNMISKLLWVLLNILNIIIINANNTAETSIDEIPIKSLPENVSLFPKKMHMTPAKDEAIKIKFLIKIFSFRKIVPKTATKIGHI